MTIGRISIFWISFILLANSLGLLIIFFSSFGDTCAQFFKALFWPDEENFGTGRTCWVLVLAVVIFPFVLKKELAELRIVAAVLFSCAICFVFINVMQLLVRGNKITNTDSDKDYWWGDFDSKDAKKEFIQAFSIIFTACNF